ncbi:S-adenosyl-L-methionine-dependent methyltransferases superfamily protein [Artemisia annua]|uniref:S-adenosyl-L-methionine-dependent methyltransferases superfamily protein n=1 Tax=Artemisia annua TaxID=35608 RepID=A0A2U1M4W0_ARTAN|nr:S-adenosyl-L-methionine-dependent methyltransferases superfamily protein [Artemisia annua]
MGKQKKKVQQQQEADLLSTLEDFTSKENWDKFFSIKGKDDPFEWYAEWPQLRQLLLTNLSSGSLSDVQILVPGCGNSRLSEQLYDEGFVCITNIDFSKVVIGDMLKRNVRDRPCMRWRVMDMTCMQIFQALSITNDTDVVFMAASDGIKERKVVHQVTSELTGQIVVDDVVYENVDGELGQLFPSKDLVFRRLTFERSEWLIQSEGLLTSEGSQNTVVEKGNDKSKKKGSQKSNVSNVPVVDSSSGLSVDHGYLASSYHSGIVSGFMLISSYLERVASSGGTVSTVVIGLGAGLLPMFLHGSIPFLQVEAAELDPAVVDLARGYFGFKEDDRLKVHVTDGIKFVGDASTKVDILIVDVDSPDSSSGMTCPAADFVEESFLKTVKTSLSEEGLFVINLVSRSSAIKEMVISRMKVVRTCHQMYCACLRLVINSPFFKTLSTSSYFILIRKQIL